MDSKAVVVVEDDPAILLDAVGTLEQAGLTAVSFNNADDALAYIYERADGIAAIFTDLQMPGQMDGLVLAEIVGRHWPNILVLLTSGRVRPLGTLPNNVRFLEKPWAPQQLLSFLLNPSSPIKPSGA